MEEWQPTIHNNLHEYTWQPAYEVRGTEVYPTLHNSLHEYTWLPVYSADEHDGSGDTGAAAAVLAGLAIGVVVISERVRSWWRSRPR